MPDQIPWEDIDAEIRPLVALLNKVPGITTLQSCAGHNLDEEAYVSFTADAPALARVLAAIPEGGIQGGYRENRPWVQHGIVTVHPHATHGVVYALRIWGIPLWAQREAIAAVERRLR